MNEPTLKTVKQAMIKRMKHFGLTDFAIGRVIEEFDGFEKKARKELDENKIKNWLANTEDLPLLLRVQTIIGLYRKEILNIE